MRAWLMTGLAGFCVSAIAVDARAQCIPAETAGEIQEGRLVQKTIGGERVFILQIPIPACLTGRGAQNNVRGTRAIQVYSSTSDVDKDTYKVFQSRGLANFHKSEYDRAIADHTQEIRLKPFYADGYLHRAAAYLAKGNVGQAITEFSEAIRIEPFRPAGYIERGSIYLSKGDTDRALADFDEAIRRLPNHPLTAAAYRKRGLVLEGRGNLTEALAAFETALSLTPSDADAREGGERVRAALSRQRGG